MRAFLVAMLLALSIAPARGAIRCGDDPDDAGKLLVQRAAIAATCDCNGLRSAFLACARDRIELGVGIGVLRPECVRDARRCASRSTCGRPGAVSAFARPATRW